MYEHPLFWTWQVMSSRNLGYLGKARELFEELGAGDIDAYTLLAFALLIAEEFDESLAIAGSGLQLERNDRQLNIVLFCAQVGAGRLIEAGNLLDSRLTVLFDTRTVTALRQRLSKRHQEPATINSN